MSFGDDDLRAEELEDKPLGLLDPCVCGHARARHFNGTGVCLERCGGGSGTPCRAFAPAEAGGGDRTPDLPQAVPWHFPRHIDRDGTPHYGPEAGPHPAHAMLQASDALDAIVAGNVALAAAEARAAQAENALAFAQAAADGAGSLLLDVQQNHVAAHQRAERLAALLAKATTRLEILCGRMAACDEDTGAERHALSLVEAPAWIEEQRAALAGEPAGG